MILSCHFTPKSSKYVEKRNSEWIKGITLVAPPDEFSTDPMHPLKAINSEWVAVVPYAFSPQHSTKIYYGEGKQWWGETKEGIIESIELAHQSGMKVLLKPHLWLRGTWTGDMTFETSEEWSQWEREYRHYILEMANLADSMNVEMFCIGNEFKTFVVTRAQFWKELIDAVRSSYDGSLTYGSNWDEFEMVPFWEYLDFIGINAYFPLVDAKRPEFSDLLKAWEPVKERISRVQEKVDKPVVFTEYGYLSTEFNTHNTWDREKMLHELEPSEEAQSVAIDALFFTFYQEDWWYGGFLWKWYPFEYRIRNREKDYTPQGKVAESTLNNWFLK